mmetsp:Transcript_34809/g.68265  ORF Transcript_34809/g.68265 Transcript_34809/m.68265 type:complete len:262 (+) Transcript_34809:421-1206(+)
MWLCPRTSSRLSTDMSLSTPRRRPRRWSRVMTAAVCTFPTSRSHRRLPMPSAASCRTTIWMWASSPCTRHSGGVLAWLCPSLVSAVSRVWVLASFSTSSPSRTGARGRSSRFFSCFQSPTPRLTGMSVTATPTRRSLCLPCTPCTCASRPSRTSLQTSRRRQRRRPNASMIPSTTMTCSGTRICRQSCTALSTTPRSSMSSAGLCGRSTTLSGLRCLRVRSSRRFSSAPRGGFAPMAYSAGFATSSELPTTRNGARSARAR